MSESYTGGCFCGAVQVEVTGEPNAMGYCHCESCRHWSAGPVNAFTLWDQSAVTVTRGEDKLGSYAKTPGTIRKWCVECGGHVLSDHPDMGATDVFAAITPGFPHQPALHVNYQETTLRVPDGLPKFKDFPAEFGGSGEMLAE